MMALLSHAFDGALALLMVVLIAYCVKLNRGLSAIRSSDTQINALIARLIESSDRAEASIVQLKAVGVAQERALRAAIADAEKLMGRLAPPGPVVPVVPPPAGRGERTQNAPLPEAAASSLDSLVGLQDEARASAVPAQTRGAPDDAGRNEGRQSRSETERVLLAAIRQARAAG